MRKRALIIGGGVGGAALGRGLATRGWEVTLVEATPSFVDEARGESLHPFGHAEVRRLGLEAVLERAGRRLPSIRLWVGGTPHPPQGWVGAEDGRVEWAFRLPAFQQALLDEAAATGVRVVRPARARVADAGVELELDGRTEHVKAALVVGADGVHSEVARAMGVAAREQGEGRHAVASQRVRSALEAGSVHVGAAPGVRALVFPLDDAGAARLYVVTPGPLRRRPALEEAQALFPGGLSEEASPFACVVGRSFRRTRLTDGATRVLLGDATATIDPSVGMGLSLALQDASRLVDALTSRPQAEALAVFAHTRQWVTRAHALHARWVTDHYFSAPMEVAPQWRELLERIPVLGAEVLLADDQVRADFFNACAAWDGWASPDCPSTSRCQRLT